MSPEEFILIPRNMYYQQRPVVEQVLQNPAITETEKYLSVLQRFTTPKDR